jgi:lipoprotein-anchoring transpeptidase ErfK/SrfK
MCADLAEQDRTTCGNRPGRHEGEGKESVIPARVRAAVLVAILAISGIGAMGTLSAQPAAAVDFGQTTIYFSETGHHLSKEFLKSWQANGGLMTFGYPISEPFSQDGMTVQYFERARLELHPENAGTPYIVQATLLGSWLTQSRRDEPAFRPLPADTGNGGDPGRRFFAETGHTLSYGFKEYWDQNGGLYVFGYPLSEEFQENGLTVQYFERGRFEWHPEYRGTQFEVLLGLLGNQYGKERKIDPSPVPKLDVAITAFPGLLDTRWSKAVRTQEGYAMAIIKADSLNVRSAPTTSATIVGQTYLRHPVAIQDIVDGESVDGVPVWYKIGDGRYVAAVWVEPFVQTTPPQTYSGRWVDVNLSRFYAVAYDGDRPVYAAIITAGRDGKTPPGVYRIFSRVRNETMDSATVGIPKGDPHYYYLPNVEFTQYFLAGGFALHGNYWTDPANYGGFTSNGCVGLMNKDAEWFWNYLGIGSTVQIHY